MQTDIPLITPQEAVSLSRFATLDDVHICLEIKTAHEQEIASSNSPLWDYVTLLSTIWNAGRVQGVREERKRRRNVPTKPPQNRFKEGEYIDCIISIANQLDYAHLRRLYLFAESIKRVSAPKCDKGGEA